MSMLPCIEIQTPATEPIPQASVIVLHGLGADGNDFVSLAHQLALSAVGPVRFIFPHAPVIPVTINAGYEMRAWYDIRHANLAEREDAVGLRASHKAISALIDREQERGVSASRIVLAGFSQGCAMTLLSGLRYPQRLAGLAGLSGYLPLLETTASERHPANHDTPIFLAHGLSDLVVPLSRGLAARDLLQSLHYHVEWHTYPMQHSVCAQEVADLERWLLKVLSPTTTQSPA